MAYKTAERVLRILHRLNNASSGIPIQELAHDLKVHVRTIERDFSFLRDFGVYKKYTDLGPLLDIVRTHKIEKHNSYLDRGGK